MNASHPDTSFEPAIDGAAERPWIHLETTHDVEAWINSYDWDLRRHVAQTGAESAGICFRLEQGGEVFLHTTPEGEVRLELTDEAAWITPVIGAATGMESAPGVQKWTLPGELLTQLMLGLSGLIATSRPVAVVKKRQRIIW
jgi:hypothetical protein